MTIQQQENALFAKWSSGRPSFHQDGVVDETAWGASRTRLLFVLKEVNARKYPKGDLRTHLRDHERKRMWRNVARWVAAIRLLEADPTRCPDWTAYKNIDEKAMRKHLATIAAVNIKKSAGGGTSSARAIRQAAEQDKTFIKDQLSLYRPHLVICCGHLVGDLLVEHIDDYKGLQWKSDGDTIRHARAQTGALVFSHFHPAARCPNQDLVEPLIRHISAIGFRIK